MLFHPLPFFDDRTTPIDMLIFHCSALNTAEMLETLHNHQLSCHYIIDTDGTITSCVEEQKRAWHSGLGSWREIKTDTNSHSIGIELTSLSLGQLPYSELQIESLINLSRKIINRHHIKPQNIVGHSDTAPTRKPDPGIAFPWQRLACNGIGLWYDISQADFAPTDDLKKLLSGIGYNTDTEESFHAAQYAFARHFFPKLVQTNLNIGELVDNVYPLDTDFSTNDELINVAKAVYMRFNP